MEIDTMRTMIRKLADDAWDALDDEGKDRQLILENLVKELRRLAGPAPQYATVILFKPSGKYYTEEPWKIPMAVQDWSETRGIFTRNPIGPYDMMHSPDSRRIDGGAVLVPEQEPWGYPHLFPAVSK